jgi:hypothetical protein
MELLEVDPDNLVRQMLVAHQEFVPQWSNLSYWFPEEFLPFLFKVWGFYHSQENKAIKHLLLIPLLKTTRYFSYDDERVHKLYSSRRPKEKIKLLRAQNWQDLFY